MRRTIGQVLLLLLIHGMSYAQKDAPIVAVTNIASIKITVDSLNKASGEIYRGAPDEAREMAGKALLLSEKIKYNTGTGLAYVNLGHVYWSQSYYPISLFYLNSALSYLPKDNSTLLAECYSAIGRTYLELKNYEQAINSLNQSAKYAGRDVKMLGEFYTETSLVYIRMHDYARGMAASLQALKLCRASGDDNNANIIYTRLSSIQRLQKQFQKSIAYDDTAYYLSFKTHNRRLRAKTLIEYADNYNGLKQFDKAIVYATKGAALADSIGLMSGISDAYRTIMFSFEQKNDLANALLFQKKYNAALDSLNESDRRRNTELIQNYFALNARLKEIAIVEQRAKEDKDKIHFQNAIIITLFISLLVVLIALYITYYNFKQKKLLSNKLSRQHEALLVQKGLIEEQSANLAAVNKLKDKLLAVIGHDLRTPFANLRSIMGLFENDNLNLEDMHGLMKKMEPVIKGGELTLSNLLEWASSQIRGINLTPSAVDINLVGEEMTQVYCYQLQQKNIRFQNIAITGHMIKADEKHIKVIIGNLISNAIKFTDDNGIVTLSSHVADDELVVNVNDTGKGIAGDRLVKLFDLNSHFTQNGTMGEVGTGIGLFLCKELVEFNGGRLWVKSEVGKGSTFSFSLPLAN